MSARKTKGLATLVGVLGAMLLLLTVRTPVNAAATPSVEEFYKGKTVELVVGFDSGNTVDLVARIVAPYLAKQIGATVVVMNQGGGGGLVARNKMFRLTKPDGLTLMLDISGALWPYWLLDMEGVQYDVTKFEYLAGINSTEIGFFVNPKGNYTSVDALKKATKPIRFAVSGVANMPSITLLNTIEVLGLNAIVAPGYKNSMAYFTAVLQGEADGSSSELLTAMNYEKSGQAKVLFSEGIKRDGHFRDIPCLAEIAKIPEPAMKLFKAMPYNGRIIMAPPGTPQEKVQYLKKSIDAVLANKELQAAVAKLVTYWPGAISGEEVKKMASEVGQNKASSIPYYKSLVDKYVK